MMVTCGILQVLNYCSILFNSYRGGTWDTPVQIYGFRHLQWEVGQAVEIWTASLVTD